MSEGINITEDNITTRLSKSTVDIAKRISGVNARKKQRMIDNVATFIGASGGSGTSTLVANVAYKIREKGLSVLVVDMNVLYPVQHNYFGLKQEGGKDDLIQFLMGKGILGDCIETVDEISVMYANNRSMVDIINCDSKVCSKNLESGLDRLKTLFDIVLIDCSKQDVWHDVINTAIYVSDSIYLVWDENIGSIANTDKIKRNLTVSGIESTDKIYIIMNKRTDISYSMGVIDELGYKLISTIPYSRDIVDYGLKGDIFCKSGASLKRESSIFYSKIEDISMEVLHRAGYRE